MANVEVVLVPEARAVAGNAFLDTDNQVPIFKGDSSWCQITPFGVVWWENGYGNDATIWPWHQISKVTVTKGAVDALGLKPNP